MDLKKLDLAKAADNGFEVVILHPITGEDLEHEDRKMYVSIVGKDSRTFKEAQQRLARKAQDAARGKRKYIDFDETAQNFSKILAECTISGEVFYNGEWVDMSNENDAYEVYCAFEWLRNQVDVELSNRENLQLEVKKS